ncbi:MAG: hypothetical protein ACJ76F_13310 [Bacteroidia bacterium]
MKILQTEMLSNDLAGTRKFYHDSLGLKIKNESENVLSFEVGSSTLAFKKTGAAAVYHFAFTVPRNKTEEALKWISAKTQPIPVNEKSIAEFDNWNARSIYFYDNNRNILEFIARMDLDNSSDTDFSSASILSLSEAAVVTDDVISLADRLKAKYGIPLFDKQPLKENFAACGNDEGLIILSQPGRHWYPTEQPAHKHYSKILVSQSGKQHEIIFNP